jgi:hypothetical protein
LREGHAVACCLQPPQRLARTKAARENTPLRPRLLFYEAPARPCLPSKVEGTSDKKDKSLAMLEAAEPAVQSRPI